MSEKAQLLGYLRALNLSTGFLINFPQPTSTRNTNQVDFLILDKNAPIKSSKEENTPTIDL